MEIIGEAIVLPRLAVITRSPVPGATREAFEIGHALSHQAIPEVCGVNLKHRFSTLIPDQQIALEAVCRIADQPLYGIAINEAFFSVIDLEDRSRMSITLWRDEAKATSVDDEFSQGIIRYFRDYLSQAN